MAIPSHFQLMVPVLTVLSRGEAQVREILAEVSDMEQLSEQDRTRMLPSGRITQARSRVSWSVQYLLQAGAIDRVRRGAYAINHRGRNLLRAHPNGITDADLRAFPEYIEYKNRGSAVTDQRAATDHPDTEGSGAAPSSAVVGEPEELPPDERILQASADLDAKVAADLVQRINERDPIFLEQVVLELMAGMGYSGRLGTTERLGRNGDEGVDGVISQDALGLDKVYVQAKRYGSGRVVGRPDIQAFVGALHGQQASRGVFITTSRFSTEARDYAARVAASLVLVDGPELGKLMVAHRVGVQITDTVVITKVDEDFFG